VRRRLRGAALIGLLAVGAACDRVRGVSLLSVEQEIAIGREAAAEVRRDLPLVSDGEVADYLAEVGHALVAAAGGPPYPYSFSVVDAGAVNAFALPGGPVLVHRGVLTSATTEAQLASVVAHEIAHISRRHAAAQMTTTVVANLGLGLLGAVLGNDLGAGAARMAASFMATGITQKFSRDDERDADSEGLRMLTAAGWEARGMTDLLDVLRRQADRDPTSVEQFFSSHPAPAERVDRLRAAVAGHRGGRRDSPRFHSMKARLARRAVSRPRTHP